MVFGIIDSVEEEKKKDEKKDVVPLFSCPIHPI